MKVRLILVVFITTLVVLLTSDVRGQDNIVVPAVTNLAIGSVEKVTAHAISLGDSLWVYIYQLKPEGGYIQVHFPAIDKKFTNKLELDIILNQEIQKGIARVNTNTLVDKTRPFRITSNLLDYHISYTTLLNYYKEFSLVQSNGQYYAPELDNASLSLGSRVHYKVPNIKWAIMEVFDEFGRLIYYTDSRWEPDWWISQVDTYGEHLVLHSDFITGDYNFRLYMVSGDDNVYQVFNRDGMQIPETPVILKPLTMVDGTNTVVAYGGDPGRWICLQSSTNLTDWTDLVERNVYYTGSDWGITYREPVNAPRKFYRTKTVNKWY